MATELSNAPCLDSDLLMTQKGLQQKITDLQYTDEDEPLEMNRKIQEQLMAFKAFNSHQAKTIADACGLPSPSPSVVFPLFRSVCSCASPSAALSLSLSLFLCVCVCVCVCVLLGPSSCVALCLCVCLCTRVCVSPGVCSPVLFVAWA